MMIRMEHKRDITVSFTHSSPKKRGLSLSTGEVVKP